ncbi:c-type cytochrome [Pseudomonas aeruginosa]|uniref:c-type cytochrome n=1 Tax=Pseudomonas aeruginosa TaxID=287 RepID=UPI000FD6162A|nr:cytochrome c [Pseudomonas aeruginosa]RUF09058.1 cytochrome c [Pseudomonas aeruginosa]
MALRGGLGPPLLLEALTGKPDTLLRATLLDGRPDTPMPGWRGLLSEAEVDWLVRCLKQGKQP